MNVENRKNADNKYIITDVVQGDEKLAKSELFNDLNWQEIQEGLKLITGNPNLSEAQKHDLMVNLWRINYEIKPPTMKEFLTPKFIGGQADKMYDHVKKTLIDYMHPNSGKRVLALSSCIGWGKAQALDSKLMTPTGYKLMKSIQVGDYVSTPSGKSKVTAIHPQGKKELYRISFDDKTSTLCCLEHIWRVGIKKTRVEWNAELKKTVYVGYEYEWQDITTKELLTEYKKRPLIIPSYTPVEFEASEALTIHPYILGALLGDGGMQNHVNIGSIDSPIIEKIKNLVPDNINFHEISNGRVKTSFKRYIFSRRKGVYLNPFKQELKKLGLFGKNCYSKFIPDKYKYASVNDRIELLRGLMDTDGTIDKKLYSHISLKNLQLIEDIKFIVESLGGQGRVQKKKDGMYRLLIRIPNEINPFSLPRKAELFESRKEKKKTVFSMNRIIKDISFEKVAEAQCITIEDSEGLYFTDNFIVTHNSSLSSILVLYIIVQLQYMRNPKKYFNLSEMGSIVIALLSFTQKKANQLLMKPFVNLLKLSPIFHQVRMEERLAPKQKSLPRGHISYTHAGRLGSAQFSKDIHISIISDRADLLGLNIIAGIASEISFFAQRGIPPEEIWGTFTDLRERINSRFANAYLTTTILDSSPIDLEISPIDKWLYSGEASKDPEVMLVNDKHWDVFPEKYKIWRKTGETFPIFRGNSSKPPKMLDPKEIKNYAPDDIYRVPIDKKLAFQQNLKKSIADLCAYPSGGISKLFENMQFIEKMFTPLLKNQYFPIEIPEEKNPKELIWNQIRDKFFIEISPNVYEFYRSPLEPRAIHIDLSETGDISGLTMSHLELNTKGERVILHDFNLPLQKGNTRINIDAVCEFILDLRDKGNMNLFKVTADQYQSASILQRLRREDIDAEKLSVDRETTPYMLYASEIKGGRVKCGRSIHLKNNLKSLIEQISDKGHKKVEHIKGEPIYEDDFLYDITERGWNMCQVGFKAKDVSDSSCGSAYTLLTEYQEIPRYIFNEALMKKDMTVKKIALKNLKKKYLVPANE